MPLDDTSNPPESNQPCDNNDSLSAKVDVIASPEVLVPTTDESSVALIEHELNENEKRNPELTQSQSSCRSLNQSNDHAVDHCDEALTSLGCEDKTGSPEARPDYFSLEFIPSPPEISIILSDHDSSTDYGSSDSSSDSSSEAVRNCDEFENISSSSFSSLESYKALEEVTNPEVADQTKDLRNKKMTTNLTLNSSKSSSLDSYKALREIDKRTNCEGEDGEKKELDKETTDSTDSLSEVPEDLICMICDLVSRNLYKFKCLLTLSITS
jgi:hypothetical protein